MNLPGLLGLFCGVAVVLAGLLATYFLWVDPQKKNRWLGLLFLAIALRVGKSIGYFILYEVAAPWVALGYVGLASTGPLLWVYVRMQTGQAPLRASLLHGLLPLVGAISIWAADGAYASDWYQLTTLLLLGYLVATALRWWKSRSADRAYYWEGQVLLGTGIVWVAYVIQHLSDTMQGYAWGAAVAALPLYGLMVRMARQGRVQPKRTPKAETVPADVLQKVRAALETEQGYLQRHLTLSQFAASIRIPAYRVTQAIQQAYGGTFPEAINALRVREAQHRLTEDPKAFIKMEVLAQEVGFNSPSAFYAAFKKETGSTPKAYQKAKLQTQSPATLPTS